MVILSAISAKSRNALFMPANNAVYDLCIPYVCYSRTDYLAHAGAVAQHVLVIRFRL